MRFSNYILSSKGDNFMNCIDLKKSGVINFRASLKVFCLILFVFWVPSRQSVIAQDLSEREPTTSQLMQGKVYIYKLYPQDRIGKGYKLVYMVAVPLEIHWKFKTDFENDFLLSNKLITEHHLLGYENNVAITETVYASNSSKRFRWQTISSPDTHRLDFELLNPNECGQKFHYGYIQLEGYGEHTKVTQTAYFDFTGATLWMNYPWHGGMQHYLQYTASWEQKTIVRLKTRYQ